MLTPDRIESEELLDAHEVPRAAMERSLRDLRWINRYLGGVRVYRAIVRRFSPRSILDLGSGTADLLDSVPNVALRVAGDVHHLPFRDGAVDLVTSSHFFHHFSPEENAGILAESLRVTRKGVGFTDTERHYLPLFFIALLGALRIVGPITRLDGPASVRQAYTLSEARELASRAPASRTEVTWRWPFRFALLLWR